MGRTRTTPIQVMSYGRVNVAGHWLLGKVGPQAYGAVWVDTRIGLVQTPTELVHHVPVHEVPEWMR